MVKEKKFLFFVFMVFIIIIDVMLGIITYSRNVDDNNTNDNYYLDDVNVLNSLSKNNDWFRRYEYNWDILDVVSFKNSDWSNLPLTKNFLSKYNSVDGLFKELDVVGIYPIGLEKGKFNKIKNKEILRLELLDGNYKVCLYYVVRDKNNYVDDILTYVIPDDKMNLSYEEMYGLAFNDLNEIR